jgi:CRISPR/Cas system-associated exonuclease Cas4 (RecB family)
LLFNDDGDWHLVDYKTGDVHPPGTYDSERYETQLQAYAWLVKELYDIEVSHAELIYVHAEQRREIAVSSDEFETTLGQIVDRLQLVEDNDGRTVLETDPDPSPDAEPNRATLEEGTRCGSCPYGASKGGPCDFG